MLQEELLAGDAEGLVLIQDSVTCEGRTLLKSFVTTLAQRGEWVHILSYEVSEEEFKAGFSTEVTSRLLYHNLFQDPLGWMSEHSRLTLQDFLASKLVAHLALGMQGPATVVLDSLSWLLLRLPFTEVCQILAQLTRKAKVAGLNIVKIVALLHGDLHQAAQLDALHTLARTVVMLEPAPPTVLGGDGVPRVAVVLHKRRAGKVVRKKEYFTVLPGFVLMHLGELRHEFGQESPKESQLPPTTDPAANLTFNLHLSEAERRAKEAVPLPYHFSKEKKTSLLQMPTSHGKIYYEPDVADDIDEEDPDDDLDV